MDYLINIVSLVQKLLLHHYFNTFSAISRNIQKAFLNIHTVPEHLLSHISSVFEGRAMQIWGKCGLINQMKARNVGLRIQIF